MVPRIRSALGVLGLPLLLILYPVCFVIAYGVMIYDRLRGRGIRR